MMKIYGCEAKLADPYLIEQFSSGTIGDLKMWDYYSSKSQFDNYNIYIKLAISIDTHFLHFRSISNGYFFFFLKN